jgi:hypothetical protein
MRIKLVLCIAVKPILSARISRVDAGEVIIRNNRGVVDFYVALGYNTEERVQMGKPLGKHKSRT